MNCTVCGNPFVLGSPHNPNCRKQQQDAQTVEAHLALTDYGTGNTVNLLLMADGSVRWERQD